ncbi:[Fe-Fe] hydrogenase large subunit C-terminal domain-containing protein [Oscillospiraceae bacterium MB08-C2-2]|nr:[Fe-Fe] hydrogenase large subunit C-terminal domain-containing protein [Oscillospiraceae bacterium MB08-C2-2]
MSEFFHSVTLDAEKCRGCTNCLRRCPTQAIRVRDGKARILSEKCLDCGECIRVCPYHAKKAVFDSMDRMQEFDYTIALPAPTLYGQFNNLRNVDYVLTGLLQLGFDKVYEVSKSAEIISETTRRLMETGNLARPVISSACPAVVRLIRVRFPNLCHLVLPLVSPMHAAAKAAKVEAAAQTGLPLQRIGAFFITPCPAKVTDIRSPVGPDQSWVDGAFAISDIYPRLLEKMNRVEIPEPVADSGALGVSWASSGGESTALLREKYLAADGIENVIAVLENLDTEQVGELEFIELNACSGGCVGGVLTVANPFVAKARLHRLRNHLPPASIHPESNAASMRWENPLEYTRVMQLSDNLTEAMTMMQEIDRLCALLPGLDCGSCGAPTCRTHAEDIVKGNALLNDCLFILREQAEAAGINLSGLYHRTPEETEKPL